MLLRNAVFSFGLAMLFLMPGACFVASKCGLQVSELLTTEKAKYLSGGVVDVEVGASFSIDGFTSGAFQDALTDEIGNYIPLKYYALLGNAGAQRVFIGASNAFFGWECYPTYYGSDLTYVPEYDTVRGVAISEPGTWEEGLRAFGEAVSRWANAHPEIDVCLAVPDQALASRSNPSFGLVSGVKDLEGYLGYIEDALGESTVSIAAKAYSDLSGYLEDYYYTDDHWNGFGALAVYSEVARRIGLDELNDSHACPEADVYIFNGQNSRKGLMLLGRTVREPSLSAESFSVEGAGSDALLLDEETLPALDNLGMEFNFYANWYGANAETVIINPEVQENETTMIVGDSFGQAMRWMVASAGHTTYYRWDMSGSSKDSPPLEDCLPQDGVDNIVFVGSLQDYASFLGRHPDYFTIPERHS